MHFITTTTDGPVTTITLNRPEKLNAFFGSMREDLLAALRDAENDSDCRAVIVTGAGRAFCAGGDLGRMAELQREGDVEGFRKLLDAGAAVVRQIAAMPQPVIAAINGAAAGAGCSLALACDFRIGSERATFTQSFVRLGLHPDWGATWFLPRLAGYGRAMELMMTGRTVEAAEALALGLLDRVVAAQELHETALSFARGLAAAPPTAAAGIKGTLRASATMSLAAQLELEARHQSRAFASREAAEAIAAFTKERSE